MHRSFHTAHSSAFIAEVNNLASMFPESAQEEIDSELRERTAAKAARYEKQLEAQAVKASVAVLFTRASCTSRLYALNFAMVKQTALLTGR